MLEENFVKLIMIILDICHGTLVLAMVTATMFLSSQPANLVSLVDKTFFYFVIFTVGLSIFHISIMLMFFCKRDYTMLVPTSFYKKTAFVTAVEVLMLTAIYLKTM